MLKSHTKHPIFLKSLFGVATILSFGFYLLSRGQKEKQDLIHMKGKIVYYADNHPEISRPDGKYKYLIIGNYDKLFELYIPKEQSKNYVFNFNQIMLGDTIDIYFDENSFQADQRTNNSIRFIDKNGINAFTSNPNDKTAGACIIIIGISITALLILLKQKGKII
jgi:hypothetical protein